MSAAVGAIRCFVVGVAVCATLTGCALKKPPGTSDLAATAMPAVVPPALWTAPASPSTTAQGQVTGGWLRSFGEPRLEELVQEALRYNADLAVASARVELAAGYARLAGATLLPSLDVGGRASAGNGDSGGLAGVMLLASWEFDIWGRIRSGSAAAEADFASASADFLYAKESLAAMVAKSWFLATEAKLQRTLAEEMTRASEHLLSLANDRQRVGLGDDLEIAQAEANLAMSHDTAQRLDAAFRQSVRALEILVGHYPAAQLEVPAQFSPMPGPVPVGLPSELLERRPDVIAAQRRVAAAFNRIGEAKAARLPRITLSANAGTVSSELFVLQDIENPVWAFVGGIVAPLYHGGALQTQVKIRTSEQKEAIARFAQIGIRVFGEVETALTEEFSAEARNAHLARAIAESERALAIAETRYRIGSVDFRTVEQQKLALVSARSQLLRVEAERRVQRVNVHLALGGNFEQPETAPPPASSGR